MDDFVADSHQMSAGAAERSDASVREGVLNEALRITKTDRNAAYGEPEDNFGNISDVWAWYLKDKEIDNLSSSDVAIMMILMKVARLKHNSGHRDSWVDIAGYAACGAQAAGVVNPPSMMGTPSAMGEMLKSGLKLARETGQTISLDVDDESDIGKVKREVAEIQQKVQREYGERA